MKLLLIGFDGLDYETFKDYDSGFTVSPLRSHEPPRMNTGPAWTSLYTGLTPEQHGVIHEWGLELVPAWDLTEFPPDKRFVSKSFATMNGHPFWVDLNNNGYSVELMNLPITYPPHPVNRWMVSGFPVPDPINAIFTFPEKLADILPKEYRERIDIAQNIDEIEKSKRQNKEYEWVKCQLPQGVTIDHTDTLQSCIDNARVKITAFKKLHNDDTDFGAIQYTIVDRMTHTYGMDRNDVRVDTYQAVMMLLRETMAAIPADNYWIVSDHGTERGVHRINGVFAYAGKDMRSYRVRASIIDIAPTLLYLYDIPPVIEKPIRKGITHCRIFNKYKGETLTDDEKARMYKQMKGLGYVE